MNTGRMIVILVAGQLSTAALVALVFFLSPREVHISLYPPQAESRITKESDKTTLHASRIAGERQQGAALFPLLHEMRGIQAPENISQEGEMVQGNRPDYLVPESFGITTILNRLLSRHRSRMGVSSIAPALNDTKAEEGVTSGLEALHLEANRMKDFFNLSDILANPDILEPLALSIENIQAMLGGLRGGGLPSGAVDRSGDGFGDALFPLIEMLQLVDAILARIGEGFCSNDGQNRFLDSREGILFDNRARALLFFLFFLINDEIFQDNPGENLDAYSDPSWIAYP